MGVTPQQAWAIAHLVSELRPEWQAEGVVAAIKRVADRNAALVALASIRAAADPEARTPGVIPTDGTHWRDGLKARETARSHNLPCPEHPDQTVPCGRCAAARSDAQARGSAAQLARANLRQARANLCDCGVPPIQCNEHRPQNQETTTP